MAHRIILDSTQKVPSSGSEEEISSPTLKPFEKDKLELPTSSESSYFSELKSKICQFFRWLFCCFCSKTSQPTESEISESVEPVVAEEDVSGFEEAPVEEDEAKEPVVAEEDVSGFKEAPVEKRKQRA